MGRKKAPPAADGAASETTAVPKRRLNLRIDADPHARFMLHCIKRGVKPGAMFSELVMSHCKDWDIHARRKVSPGVAKATDGQESDAPKEPLGEE